MSKYIIMSPGKKCKNNFMGYHPEVGTVFCDKRKEKPTKPCLMEIVYRGKDKNEKPYVVAIPLYEFKTKVFQSIERLLTSNDGNCQMRIKEALPTYEPGNEDSILPTLKVSGEKAFADAFATPVELPSDWVFWVLPASSYQTLDADDMIWVMLSTGETQVVSIEWLHMNRDALVNTTVIEGSNGTVRFEPIYQ